MNKFRICRVIHPLTGFKHVHFQERYMFQWHNCYPWKPTEAQVQSAVDKGCPVVVEEIKRPYCGYCSYNDQGDQ